MRGIGRVGELADAEYLGGHRGEVGQDAVEVGRVADVANQAGRVGIELHDEVVEQGSQQAFANTAPEDDLIGGGRFHALTFLPVGAAGHRTEEDLTRVRCPSVGRPPNEAVLGLGSVEKRSALALVRTKLSAPTPPANLVDRARLGGALDAAVDDPNQRLVLVSAPAGSGKSTLVSAWLGGRDGASGWFQVDETDRDPARFWTYVVAALGAALPALPEKVAPAVVAAGHDVDPLLAAIVDEVQSLDEPVVLVIDDYHLVGSERIDHALERLVDLAPTNLRLVVLTRLDPSLRLSRLRVSGALTEVRASDLRFSSDEAASLLADRTASPVDARHVAALCERTEGWAAGLVLAGLSLAGAADRDAFVDDFQGDDRLVVDYLSEEFLAGVPDAERDRLLRTSVLERMTGPLVDAVCGGDGGASWLRATADANQLLIGLDRTGHWFRYHHLLRDLLRLEASERLADELPDLHRRAGEWHRKGGELHGAVEHFLQAEALDDAADLIANKATQLLNGGHLDTVLHQLDRLGPFVEEHAGCCIVRGWTTFFAGRFSEAEEWLERARRHNAPEDVGLIAGLGTMVCLARGDVAGAVAISDQSPLPRDPTHAMVLGTVSVWAGRHDAARIEIARAIELADAAPDDYARAVTPGYLALVELEGGNVDAARRSAEAGRDEAERRGIPEAPQMGIAYAVLARCNEGPEAIDLARHAADVARRVPQQVSLAYVLASAGDVLCAEAARDAGRPINGDADSLAAEGRALLAEARTVIDRSPDPGLAGTYLARVEGRHGVAAAPVATTLIEELTERELAVLRYFPSALSQRDIAGELYVSLNTVKTHAKAIYRKLGVGDRKAAVQAARDLGLL